MRTSLKTILAAAAAAFLCAGTAQATVVFQGPFSFVGGVGTGNIIIGDKTFQNFTCLASGGPADNCTNVSYTNTATGFGVTFNPGAALNLAATGSRDVLLGFQVIINDLTQPFRLADFFLSSNSAVTGSGSVADTLEVCTTSTCSAGSVLIGPTILTGNGISFPDTNFGCVPGGVPNGANCVYTSLWIFDDVATSVGETAGAAQISRLDKVLTQNTPEPASLLLIAAGLLGMGFVRRRGTK